jgi:hypothetical protein
MGRAINLLVWTDTKMGVVGGVKPVNEILIIGTPMAIQIYHVSERYLRKIPVER